MNKSKYIKHAREKEREKERETFEGILQTKKSTKLEGREEGDLVLTAILFKVKQQRS